ncbi:hypothetical protein CIRG_00807 [Coccidioides immitis RMSCC 2394]|uniref:Uncharacterized protein n=1 Tax=Coccidioides immitis RMSCC 2394 TaxID=404692 RepID=A0A0J6XZ30_COCIT|nr:hypothetical protein CIRG_00807 [Coccidioides immitis RMSCC 2394]
MLSALRGSGLGKFTHLNSLIWSPQAASGCGVGTNPQSEACKGYADKRMDRDIRDMRILDSDGICTLIMQIVGCIRPPGPATFRVYSYYYYYSRGVRPKVLDRKALTCAELELKEAIFA